MKTCPFRDLRNALIAFFCLSTLVAGTATSAVVGVNLHLEGSQSAAGVSGQSIAQQGLGGFQPATGATVESSPDMAAALPPLAILAPNSKLGAVFPIIGLIAAVAVTQLLRRRRIAQLRANSSIGQ